MCWSVSWGPDTGPGTTTLLEIIASVPVLTVPLPHPHPITIYSVTSAYAVCVSFFEHYHFWALSYWMDWGPLRSDCCSSWHSGPLVPFLDSVSLVSRTLILLLCLPATLLSGSLFSCLFLPSAPQGSSISCLLFTPGIFFPGETLPLALNCQETPRKSFPQSRLVSWSLDLNIQEGLSSCSFLDTWQSVCPEPNSSSSMNLSVLSILHLE